MPCAIENRNHPGAVIDITEGKGDSSHPYFKLKERLEYHSLKYYPNENLYKLNTEINPSASEEASPPTEEASKKPTLEMAQKIAQVFLDEGHPVPKLYNDIINPTDINKKLYNLLQHEFWKDNTIPEYYENNPDGPGLSLDPDKPEEFVNHFWPDIDLMPIVRNSNKYIDKKNRLKNRYSPNRRRQLRKKPKKQIAHITLTEL